MSRPDLSPDPDDYDPAEDSRRCYDLGIATKRELAVRAGLLPPRNPAEERWKAEGMVPVSQFETVRNG